MSAKRDRRAITELERRVAAELGGRKTFASGSGDEKGDARVAQRYATVEGQRAEQVRHPLRVECKTTRTLTYRISRDTWEKISSAARKALEQPVLYVRFEYTADRVRLPEEWIICRGSFLGELNLDVTDATLHVGEKYPATALVRRGGVPQLYRLAGYKTNHQLGSIQYHRFVHALKLLQSEFKP
jgi:hypothetical protein